MKKIIKQSGEVCYEFSSEEERKFVMEEVQSEEHKSRVLDYLIRYASVYNENGKKLY